MDGKRGFSMEINVVIQEFGFDCKIRKLSPKTIENYQKQLTYLQRYLADEHNTMFN
jgi:site-specific recombinase XerC